MLFVREDRNGSLARSNNLLGKIFVDFVQNIDPKVDLSSVKHLTVDYWVMASAWLDLKPLMQLHNLSSLAIIMDACHPRTASTLALSPISRRVTMYERKTVFDLTNVGFQRPDILAAVRGFWGYDEDAPGFGEIVDDVEDLVLANVNAELASLQDVNTAWDVPLLDFVMYGGY